MNRIAVLEKSKLMCCSMQQVKPNFVFLIIFKLCIGAKLSHSIIKINYNSISEKMQYVCREVHIA
jgi:hypothetical protein